MYHYISCGLPNVFLRNGYDTVETEFGEATSIDDVQGLHDAIGLSIVKTSLHLKFEEVRFLRKEIGMSQRVLADLIGVSEQTVSLWERGNNQIPNSSDRLLRGFYMEVKTNNLELLELSQKLSQLQQDIDELQENEHELNFEINDGWHELSLAA